jgi:hypothetical protein
MPMLKLIRLFVEYRDLFRNIHFFDKEDYNKRDEIQKMKKELENLKLRKPNFQNDFMDRIITTQDYQEMKDRLDKARSRSHTRSFSVLLRQGFGGRSTPHGQKLQLGESVGKRTNLQLNCLRKYIE